MVCQTLGYLGKGRRGLVKGNSLTVAGDGGKEKKKRDQIPRKNERTDVRNTGSLHGRCDKIGGDRKTSPGSSEWGGI